MTQSQKLISAKVLSENDKLIQDFRNNLRKAAEGLEFLLIGAQRQYNEGIRAKARLDDMKQQFDTILTFIGTESARTEVVAEATKKQEDGTEHDERSEQGQTRKQTGGNTDR